jgi:hypothetical protein
MVLAVHPIFSFSIAIANLSIEGNLMTADQATVCLLLVATYELLLMLCWQVNL